MIDTSDVISIGVHPKISPVSAEGCWLAGGAVLAWLNRTPIADYDFYPKNEKAREKLAVACGEGDGHITAYSKNALTFKNNAVIADRKLNPEGNRSIIQVMTFKPSFDEPEDIFENFDFTICMAAQDCDTGEIFVHKNFVKDNAGKRLVFNSGTLYPLASMARVSKYLMKGFTISRPQLLQITNRCAVELQDLDDVEPLRTAMGGYYGNYIDMPELTSFGYNDVQQYLEKMDEATGNYSNQQFLLIKDEGVIAAMANRSKMICFLDNNYLYIVYEDDNQWFIEGMTSPSDTIPLPNAHYIEGDSDERVFITTYNSHGGNPGNNITLKRNPVETDTHAVLLSLPWKEFFRLLRQGMVSFFDSSKKYETTMNTFIAKVERSRFLIPEDHANKLNSDIVDWDRIFA